MQREHWLYTIPLRLRSLFHWAQADQELDDELRDHLERKTGEYVAKGMAPEEARRRARLDLGGIEQTKEKCRDARGGRLIEMLVQDVRFGLRMLRKNPGFTTVGVLTLALGIGANTAIFSVIDAVILRPLPFASPDRLVWLNGKFPMGDQAAVSPPDFRDYRAANRTFEKFAALALRGNPSNLAGDKPEQVLTSMASADFFSTLGVQPLLGRDFALADEDVQLPQAVILGYRVWKRDFGSDSSIMGRTIRLDGQNLTVIGVLPTDIPLLSEAEIWVPTPMRNHGMNMRLPHFLGAIGRLKPGVSLAQSTADTDSIAAHLAGQYPDTDRGWSLRQRPLTEVLIGPVKPALLLISAAVGLLLLIACANIANLLLARSIARHREFSVRAALGAGRGRMIHQTLTESVVLALFGGVLGIVGAIWGVHALRAIGPSDLPRLQEVRISGGVLAFTAGLSFLTGIVFGLVPALQISGGAFAQGLKDTGRTSASGSHKRLGGALVVCEIAVSLTLLVGAGLLLKSFWRLIHVNPGFQTAHVISARLSLNAPIYNDDAHRVQFWQQLEQRVATLPGVEAVGATSELPLTGEHSDCPFYLPGRTYGPSEFDDANCRQVTPGYLATMRIPLLAGRSLDERDTPTAPKVMLVNEAFAARYLRHQTVLGKQLQVMEGRLVAREVVGVVGTITHDALSDLQAPEMYIPYAQSSPPTMRLVVRATADPQNLAAALRDVVSSIDEDETLSAVRSMDDVLESSVAQPRFSSQLLGLFAALAVLLSAIGLYGLMAYSVTQRVNELGIRIALGATRGDILKLILKHGSLLTFTGMGIGLIASLAAARVLSNLLFGITPTDPATFLGVALLLTAVALAACYIPARRAMRVDPMVALRYE